MGNIGLLLRSAGRFSRHLFIPFAESRVLRLRVTIENSAGQRSTSLKHARNYIKRKRAEWVAGAETLTIRFLPTPQHRAVKKSAAKPREEGRFYDAGLDNIAEPYQVRGAGAVGEIERLYTLGIRGTWAWDISVWHRPKQNRINNDTGVSQPRGIA